MRVLVTGVAGFIGSTLAERLVREGHDVLGVDAFTDYYARATKEANVAELRASPHFRLIEDDLTTMELGGVVDGVEVVFHEAAQAGVRSSWGASFDVYTAITGTSSRRSGSSRP